jgi:hypothetical protein
MNKKEENLWTLFVRMFSLLLFLEVRIPEKTHSLEPVLVLISVPN